METVGLNGLLDLLILWGGSILPLKTRRRFILGDRKSGRPDRMLEGFLRRNGKGYEVIYSHTSLRGHSLPVHNLLAVICSNKKQNGLEWRHPRWNQQVPRKRTV